MVNTSGKARYFSTCDVARIAKNCIEDTGATEIEVLTCVALEFGINYLAIRFEKVFNETAISGLDFEAYTEGKYLEGFIPDKRYGKVPPSKLRKLLYSFRAGLSSVLNVLSAGLDLLGLGAVVLMIIQLVTGFELVNIDEIKTKQKEKKNKDDKEFCNCHSGRKNDWWENQERDEKGRFS